MKHEFPQVPTRTVVQIRTHAQKYFQKLAKEHGTDAAEQAFSSGIQLGVEMGTRVAETEVDTIFERYPDALAAAKQSERVLPTLPRNTASESATRGRESGPARADGAGARAAAAATSAPRRATKRRRADGKPEAPVRTSSRPPARSRRAIAAAAAAEGYAEEDEEEELSRRRYGRRPRERSAVPGMEEEEDDNEEGPHPHAHMMGAYGPLPGGPIPPGAVRRRAFDPPFHSGAMRIPMMGHPVGMGRGFPMAMHGNVPPTPTTANAALMLVKGKTSANLAGGRNTPRTLRTAQWLNDLSSVPGQAAAVMVQPAGGGAGIAGAGRRAAAPAMAQPANPWGCAAAAQAQSQEGERAAEAAASGFPEGAGGVSAVGMHDNQLIGPGEGMSMVPPEGYLMKVYHADGQLVTVLERDPRALAAEHGMVEEHDEAPQGAYPGVYAPVHAPHTEQHPSPDAGGEVGDEGNPSG